MTIEYQNIHGNRNYKSSLFCMVFDNQEDLLDLYEDASFVDAIHARLMCVLKKLQKDQTIEAIAAALEESVEVIERIANEITEAQ